MNFTEKALFLFHNKPTNGKGMNTFGDAMCYFKYVFDNVVTVYRSSINPTPPSVKIATKYFTFSGSHKKNWANNLMTTYTRWFLLDIRTLKPTFSIASENYST